ncbi:MAG TPA: septal ring lytic transglycosylase RlpA family protein [Solimonas sp.]
MRSAQGLALSVLLSAILTLSACSAPAPRGGGGQPAPRDPAKTNKTVPFSKQRDYGPQAHEIPPDIDKIPDAVPRHEPRSRSGNSPVYEVFGKTYRVMDTVDEFRERGSASWYGKKFHGRKTASGEAYDMYAMTAAHKSLPLPAYVRVTHLENGRSIVVKVNDRGPFHPGRIIDLSYAAAAKLDIIRTGHGPVEIELVKPDAAPRPPQIGGWLQVGAYADAINAVALREDLNQHGIGTIQILVGEEAGEPLHRVVMGPYMNEAEAAPALRRLRIEGYSASWIRP